MEDKLKGHMEASNEITFIQQGSQEEQRARNLLKEIMAENFPNLGKETSIQIQEGQKIPAMLDLKRSTSRHIIITMSNVIKERNLKAARGKHVIYKGITKTISRFFQQNFIGQEGETQYICVLKGKKDSTKNTLPSKIIIDI